MVNLNRNKKIAEVLSEFLVKQKFEDLPKETIKKAKYSIIDIIGCTVGASKEPQANVLIEVIKAEGGNPWSSVFAHDFKTSVMNAALIKRQRGAYL